MFISEKNDKNRLANRFYLKKGAGKREKKVVERKLLLNCLHPNERNYNKRSDKMLFLI